MFEYFGVDIPGELKPFINDYRLNIIDIAKSYRLGLNFHCGYEEMWQVGFF